MLKHIHLLFVALAAIGFIGRVAMAQYQPEMLQRRWIKLSPHILAGLLLLSGIGLVFQGDWLANSYAWIVAKLILMFVFIGLGLMTMREQGEKRWIAFAAALFCLFYIVKVAFAKQVFFFL
ncbi:SirB2 family protein [Methylomonas sp. SURF-2]|uniref:SirB2 family protein n=1 Tax=Methylomonas subterranea TaxID=2952225 RepID=A0ABT1TE03_9GAMM|nr:SirB2 family protein [Methylomonas sp. SURF-2]MCQ8103694.1 SirB2 family protein [Methylomonas sp. SURF-2]